MNDRLTFLTCNRDATCRRESYWSNHKKMTTTAKRLTIILHYCQIFYIVKYIYFPRHYGIYYNWCSQKSFVIWLKYRYYWRSNWLTHWRRAQRSFVIYLKLLRHNIAYVIELHMITSGMIAEKDRNAFCFVISPAWRIWSEPVMNRNRRRRKDRESRTNGAWNYRGMIENACQTDMKWLKRILTVRCNKYTRSNDFYMICRKHKQVFSQWWTIMVQIDFEVMGEKQLSRNLRVLVSNVANMQWFYKDSIDIVHNRSNMIFKDQWKNVEKAPKRERLAIRTQKARDRRRWYYKRTPNKPWILRRTWRLQSDITKEVTREYWLFKYNAPYAQYHQEWSTKLPKRAIIDLSNKTNTEIVKAMQKKIQEDIWIFWLQV